MEGHKLNLKNLCRICGSKIILKYGYKTAKTVEEYSDALYQFYDIDIDMESDERYPKCLCGNCKRKLDRLKYSQESKAGFSKDYKAATFLPHSVENCMVCLIKKNPGSETIALLLRNLDKMMASHSYQAQQSNKYKRIYLKTNIVEDVLVNEVVFFLNFSHYWHLQINNKIFSPSSLDALNGLPERISDENIKLFDDFFSKLRICVGISEYSDVIQARLNFKEPFLSKDGAPNAFVEDQFHNQLIKDNFKIFRSINCEYLSNNENNICKSCYLNQSFLRSCRSRLRQEDLEPERKRLRTSDTSTANLRYLSREELIERVKNAQNQKKEAIRHASKLHKIVQKEIEKEGVELSKEQNENLSKVLKENPPDFEEGSPAWLLWQQQKEMAEKKDSRGMRWHPLMIRWCLSIYYTSASAYKQLSSNKLSFLKLPHISTLEKYGNFTKPTSGFNPDILNELMTEAKLDSSQSFKKNVTICFDEMRIKSNLVYSKSTGRLVGFTEMGSINDEFRKFQDSVESQNSGSNIEREFASYVLVYMVRGIFSNLCYPFAYFASTGFTAAQLYPCTLEATKVLMSLGFSVRAYVCDGASPNRKFFKLIAAGSDDDFYWAWNAVEKGKKIYMISDAPHLLKTTRNCLENSCWNKKTRNLHFQHCNISWKHIVDAYEWDLSNNQYGIGLRKMPRLTEEHINLTPRLRMKVKLAAQVLSRTTASGLESQDRHDTSGTVKFLRMIDRVFDCLNISHFNQNTKGKPECKEYRDVNDWRFEFLEKDFLEDYLGQWKMEVERMENMSQTDKNRLLLSKQTIMGWKITIKSFVSLAKELLAEDGVKFLLSEKFTQDPLEEHFAKQRRRGGCNENPDLYQFGKQEIFLNVMNSSLITDLRGNSSTRFNEAPTADTRDTRQLPKKRK